MLDANAVGVDINVLFFAEVRASNQQLKNMGLSSGDIVLCKHDRKTVKSSGRTITQTKLWPKFNGEPYDYYDSGFEGFLVYSGLPTGEEFIDNAWKAKAFRFLENQWLPTNSLS